MIKTQFFFLGKKKKPYCTLELHVMRLVFFFFLYKYTVI